VAVHKVPLRYFITGDDDDNNDDDNNNGVPFCLAASSIGDLQSTDNVLATQVWPSARVASYMLERYYNINDACSRAHQRDNNNNNNRKQPLFDCCLCELGCGPGLPSLTAAKLGFSRVIATDIDELALELVKEAARLQKLDNIIETQPYDLTSSVLPPAADLYLLSDVFETSHVALGAAKLVARLVRRQDSCCIWVFAQTDRVQREIFLNELRVLLDDATLAWTNVDDENDEDGMRRLFESKLWLCNVDESKISYG
jgi:hypothetical protein